MRQSEKRKYQHVVSDEKLIGVGYYTDKEIKKLLPKMKKGKIYYSD